jgi:tetratricopeptide (TPR) repeat protein
LEYEREEEAIFNITENLSVDIEVEDLGSLAGLRGQLELNHYNVIHLSSHTAMIDEQPYFIMEQETGYHHMVSPEKLWDEALIENPPQVLFLSGNGATVSFARQMVEKHPVPVVLGWGRPVGDEQVIHAVKRFYHQLSKGETILKAVQRVRCELIKGFGMSPPSAWPLLRLFSSDPVLSALVTKGRLKQPKPRRMKHIFLKQSQVLVLEEGFVGRRRQLQQSIAALKQNFDKVGVLLLGARGLGKSCLAGKICERFPYHTLIIIQGKFNAITLEVALKDAFIHSQDNMGKALLKEKRNMEEKLADLCSTCFKEKNYLLLLDNFEQNLENWDESRPGPLLPEAAELLRVLLYYLPGSGKMTQVLITCRYRFGLTSQGIDLAAHRLEPIWLTSFQPHEQSKKSRGLKHIYNYQDPDIGRKLLAAGCGNPSLMDWINRLVGELSEAELPELLTAVENQKESFISDHVIGELVNRSSKQLTSFLYWFSIYRMPVSMEGARLVGEQAGLVEWNEPLIQGVNLGLVEYHQSYDSYMVTPLLREKLLTRLDSNHLQQSHRAAFIFFSNRCASVEEVEPRMLEELIFHALGCGEAETAARQGTRLVNYLRECLALRESRRVGEWIWAENAGKYRTEADILLLSQLANTISDMGDHSRAISCFEQVLTFWKERYGQKHLHTAAALNDLGSVWKALGEHRKAIDYFEKALDLWGELHGEKHHQKAATLNYLGAAWKALGDHQKAINYFKQALEIDETVFGRQHQKVAVDLNNLGTVFYTLKAHTKAISYFEQALDIWKRVYGQDHPQVAAAMNNLGSVWDDTGNHQKAIDYYLQALKIDEAVFGRQHAKVATRFNNLGSAWKALGDYHKAVEYFQQAFDIYKAVFGEKHEQIAAVLNNLGSAWMALEEHGKAIDYFLQALAIDEAVFGRQHTKVATRLNNLGTAYFALQQKQKAKSYFEQAYPIFAQFLGKDHPHTRAAQKWLDQCIRE